ncbi:MAG: AraC family transcriptional regulator [Ruminococcaceae bacterium]|nr:AraC family transcriptional regulator [Oscillospiraceae bacterium]
MDLIQKRSIDHEAVLPFHMQISYAEVSRDVSYNQTDSHVHPECEIYINLTGDVSFMVEKRIYPIFPGSIVITRPFEYHHCIYHGDSLHSHFWILFSANGNEHLFPRFFNRAAGENNLLTLPADRQKELFALCHKMVDCEEGAIGRQYRFFKLMHLLEDADVFAPSVGAYPQDVVFALEYLDLHYADALTVSELARQAHVSVNTLERHFSDVLHMSPTVYLRKKRLGVAAELLYGGASVMEACEASGFADYSNFIALFKKAYGITPLQYKRRG